MKEKSVKDKQENPIQVLFGFAGEEKGKMTLSVILAILGELCGMLPFLAAAMLANEAFSDTANIRSACFWAGGAALGIILRTFLCTKSSARSHKIAFTILRNIRREIADKMRRVPMGVMLETLSLIHISCCRKAGYPSYAGLMCRKYIYKIHSLFCKYCFIRYIMWYNSSGCHDKQNRFAGRQILFYFDCYYAMRIARKGRQEPLLYVIERKSKI